MPARLAAALFAVLAFLPVVPAHAAAPEVPDRIAAAWRTDRLYVDDRLTVPDSELDRIRAAAKTAGFPVYIALVPQTPYLRKIQYDLPTLLQARTGQPGLYVVQVVSGDYWNGIEELYRPGGLKGKSLISVISADKQRLDLVNDRPAPQVVRTIQQAQTAYDGRPLPPIAAEDREPERPNRGSSVTDQEDRAAFIGLGAGGFIGFVLTLFLAFRRKRRPRRVGAEPNSYVTEIRRQADLGIRKAAHAISRLEAKPRLTLEQLDQRDDANRRLAAARALRADDPDGLLAVAGALLLSRQAQRAANGAKVPPPCFFDPTHNFGTTHVDWDGVEVPACKLCATRMAKGQAPRGLHVKSVPYWTLDPADSPLVATGFGALTDDLPERITGRLDDAR
ncbi:hypothetical protein HPO96_15065 [Kribbella sandramycini]|uniref:TPM domain-containing protein n=1 Tax=Kribbella sandramycini TaxID=60450 RepID=A0A7Y4KZK1_9ACTN|nr:hypothetical protein [Kribbella sandramycini]MBB6565296.1 hypothetical protein [Kribbella sandramycini]NOL41565.1 hypothetical protein [Kribbella sandramycini]